LAAEVSVAHSLRKLFEPEEFEGDPPTELGAVNDVAAPKATGLLNEAKQPFEARGDAHFVSDRMG
jgi:hypothetical protein